MPPDKGAWLWLEGKGMHFAKIWACGLTAMIKVVIPNCLYSNSINIVRLVSKKENKSLILRLSQTEL